MPPTDENLWHSLRVGDRVLVVHYPCEFSDHDYTMHDETRDAYRQLIESRQLLTVSRIDDDGYPWVEFEITGKNGRLEYHSLILNHDGIQRADDTSK